MTNRCATLLLMLDLYHFLSVSLSLSACMSNHPVCVHTGSASGSVSASGSSSPSHVDEGPGVPCEQEDICCMCSCKYVGPRDYCSSVHGGDCGKCGNGWTGATYNFKTVTFSGNISVSPFLGQCTVYIAANSLSHRISRCIPHCISLCEDAAVKRVCSHR